MAKKKKKRDYTKELKWQATREQKKRRAQRNAARRALMRDGLVRKGDGKDVHHVRGLEGGNGRKNLRVTSRSWNRSKK